MTNRDIARTGTKMAGGLVGKKVGAIAGLHVAAAVATGPVGLATLVIGGALAGRLAGRSAAGAVFDELSR